MKKFVSFLCAGLMLLLGAGCGDNDNSVKSSVDVVLYTEGMEYTETEKGEPLTYYALYYDYLGGETVMPVGGFYAPYSAGGSLDGNNIKDFLTDEVFSALADAGINNMFYSVDRWTKGAANPKIEKALDLCEKYGIGYVVEAFYIDAQIGTRTQDIPLEDMPLSGDNGQQELQELFDEITQNGERDCVIGLLACDEPFPRQLDNLGVLSDVFDSLEGTGQANLYMNMVGRWEGENNFWGQSDPITWEDYIDSVFENVNLKMLSFTQYPYSSAETPESNLTSYFNKLSVYRKVAYEHGVPHFRMMQAGGQWNDLRQWVETVDPYPSEAELLFDVNSSLAYGCKGIQYFPLVQPEHFAYQTGETYDFENRNGLIGGAGNLTRWYYYAKRANTQVAAVDEYLMCSANVGVIVHGEDAEYYIVEQGTPSEEYISSKQFRQLTGVSGDDCIIGCFDYKGGTALYVVNYSRKEKADITLSFDKDNYRYNVIQRGQSTDVVGGRMTLTLDAGEAALVVLF